MDRYLSKITREIEKSIGLKINFTSGYCENTDGNKNKILLKIISIKKEDISSNSQYYVSDGNKFISRRKPVFFSIFISFLSTFCDEKYLDGIRFLSQIVGFLQKNNSFQKENNNDMISYNMEDFFVSSEVYLREKFGEVSNYPFLIYKISLIPISTEDIIPQVFTPISTI
jgi:hypothetical protein